MEEQQTNNQDIEGELTAKCEEYLQGWKRAKADYENLKRDNEKNAAALADYLQGKTLAEILPIYEHFKLALEHAPEKVQGEEWVKGLFHIKQQFEAMFKNLGLEPIPTVGEIFNPEFHQAVSHEESDQPEDTVIKEIRGGYKFKDKVLEPALVAVAKNK